jgi:hypothetical protein
MVEHERFTGEKRGKLHGSSAGKLICKKKKKINKNKIKLFFQAEGHIIERLHGT